MRIPLLAGELCRRQPVAAAGVDAPGDVMVNRAFATRYLSGLSSVVGLHLAAGERRSPPGRIAGVVGDARERGLDQAPAPTVYACLSAPTPTPYFLVRTHVDPLTVAQTVRLKMKELEPQRSVYDIAPLEERIGDAFNQNRLRTALVVLFAVMALSLASVGLYGTLGYVVSVRRREIASLCGLGLSTAITRVLSGMLYGVSPSDPLILSSVVAIVLAVTAVAAFVPSLRAALVQPIEVLREE
jgi:hypothetical protein